MTRYDDELPDVIAAEDMPVIWAHVDWIMRWHQVARFFGMAREVRA